MVNKKSDLKIVFPFYLQNFISRLLLFAPAFWVIFMQQYFSLFQIGVFFSLTSLATLIFEVPTGAVADIKGRKFSSLIGYFSLAIIYLLLFLTKGFYNFAILFFLLGVATTFISGAQESWIVDKLKNNHKGISNYFFKRHILVKIAYFLSGFIGAFLVYRFSMSVIWIFASLSYLASGVILSFVSETKVNKEKHTTIRELFKQTKIALSYTWAHLVLFFIFWANFFLALRDSFSGDLLWQPFLISLGLKTYWLGFLFSAFTLTGAIAIYISSRIMKKMKSEKKRKRIDEESAPPSFPSCNDSNLNSSEQTKKYNVLNGLVLAVSSNHMNSSVKDSQHDNSY